MGTVIPSVEVSDPVSAGIEDLRWSTEGLVSAFDLAPHVLEPTWAQHAGTVGRARVTLHTARYRGRGALAELRLAWTTSEAGAMASLTALALPRPEVDHGVFAADLVAFGGRLRFVAIDPDATGTEPAATGPEELQHFAELLRPIELPPHLAAPFSSQAAIGRGDEAGRASQALAPAYRAALRHFTHALGAASRRPHAEGWNAQRQLVDALQRNKREGRVLASIFGEAWSDRYLRDHFLAPP